MHRIPTLILILILVPFTTQARENSACQDHQCIAIIDAGSSGSRLHVYAYDRDETNTPINIQEIWNRKAVPGLSTVEHEHRSISVYMEKLFTDAPTVQMPVYFYSTAGMRLLPKTHHKNVNQLVADWFDKQYYWRLVSARTISGSEEGLFAWLAINYQLNLFNQSEIPLTGIMDIGGASVQIVIPIIEKKPRKSKDIINLELYGKSYQVYSHSFLGLGQNEMSHQYFDLKYCYPNEFELSSGRAGKGDALICEREISVLVNNVHNVNRKVRSVMAQNPVETWYIIGGITSMLNDKLFPTSKNQFTNQDLIAFTNEEICHQKWSDLEQMHPNNYMLYNYCMLPSFLYALTVNGYGLPPNKPINFLPATKSADWTIGVVLQHKKS